jgi:hypothetical protein
MTLNKGMLSDTDPCFVLLLDMPVRRNNAKPRKANQPIQPRVSNLEV